MSHQAHLPLVLVGTGKPSPPAAYFRTFPAKDTQGILTPGILVEAMAHMMINSGR